MSNRNLFPYPQVGRRPGTTSTDTQNLIGRLLGLTGVPAIGLYVSDTGVFQDAAGVVPAKAANDPVGRWNDLSGNGRHAVQASNPNRPILELNVKNGKPGVKFNGSSQDLFISPGYPNFTAGHIFVVAGYTTTPSAGTNHQVMANIGGAGGIQSLVCIGNLNTADKWGTICNAAATEFPGTVKLTALQHYLLGVSFSIGSTRLYRDSTTVEATLGASTPGFTWGGDTLGSGGGGGFCPCWIELVVVYGALLTGSNISTVVNSIKGYYAIP